MKKTYVSPVMETEEFVANEYVAACYEVECNQALAETAYGSRHVQPVYVQADTARAAAEKVIAEQGLNSSSYTTDKIYYHYVTYENVGMPCQMTVKPYAPDTHPNASV